jgi:tRNA-modifying protein YgfZ
VNPEWRAFLEHHGATVDADRVQHFGDPAGELHAAAGGSIVADLSHLGVLEFTGEEAQSFLHAQLSCDVKSLEPARATLGSYCSPKGRMLASFHIARTETSWLMLHSRTLTEWLRKRLQMFVLRSKVVIRDLSAERVLLGASGEPALPAADGFVTAVAGGRSVLVLTPGSAQSIWPSLTSERRPVGTGCWEWLDIRHGIPLVTEATKEQLVPQMANLELIGGVSFTKGCYPGQEIVARSQYLGKVKRRMYLASVECSGVIPAPGDELFSDDLGSQASGLVVNAQPSPSGGYDLLAVAQTSSREGSTVHLKSPDGPVLRFAALPYEVS